MALLTVENLTIKDQRTNQMIVENLSFRLEDHSCLGIVGESGSGKSMTVKGLLGLTPPWFQVKGSAYFAGENILNLKAPALRKIRGKHISMILQDAMSAFNPLYMIGKQMEETFCEHLGISKMEAHLISQRELEKVGIHQAKAVLKKYPHQLSGGMLQRCMIAIVIALQPAIIIADEPTTALDTINQKEVIDEFQRLRAELGIAIVFISHDLGVIQQLSEYVFVMKDGKHVESGKVTDIFLHPQQAYTKHLIQTRKQLTKPFIDVIGGNK